MATAAEDLPKDYSSDYQTPAKVLTNAINLRIADLSGADGIIGTRNKMEQVRQALSADVDEIIKDSQAIGSDVTDLVINQPINKAIPVDQLITDWAKGLQQAA